jgi:ketosteroid isomerase-like protein
LAEASNDEICRQLVEAVSERRIDDALGLTDPEIELIDPDLPGGGRFRGHAGAREYLDHLLEPFEEATWEVERLIPTGAMVVGFLHGRMRGKGSGIEVDMRDGHLWTLRGGRIVRWRTYLDRAEALRDAGLDPQS